MSTSLSRDRAACRLRRTLRPRFRSIYATDVNRGALDDLDAEILDSQTARLEQASKGFAEGVKTEVRAVFSSGPKVAKIVETCEIYVGASAVGFGLGAEPFHHFTRIARSLSSGAGSAEHCSGGSGRGASPPLCLQTQTTVFLF